MDLPCRLSPLAAGSLLAFSAGAWAAEPVVLDEISVTATRDARATKDVPQSIAVIGKQQIADSKMMNLKDGVVGVPGVLLDTKNGGYDAKLVIRGSGLNAAYGIREVMILRDGVPLTDPDSMSRLDFIDTQDIERIEITKGPGNLYSPGSAGGAIQIISKSVFDETANVARLGVGSFHNQNEHLRLAKRFGDQALALTYSHRAQDNDWRNWNKFSTTQAGVKHGAALGNSATLESELSYTETNFQLPGSMSTAQFATFKQNGSQTATQDVWKNNGRYSKIWFFNSKYEQEIGSWTLKPRVYFNAWSHYHPVTGTINDSHAWTKTLGTDLEAQNRHSLAGMAGVLVAGVTIKQTKNDDARQYQYKDITTAAGRITATLSDREGSLANVQRYTDTLNGVFFQESLKPTADTLVDIGFRYDKAKFDISTNTFSCYDYALGKYTTTAGSSCAMGNRAVSKTFNLFSPKLAASYRLTPQINAYASLSQADQVLQTSYIQQNPNLDAPRHRMKEVGVKGRAEAWQFDLAYYDGRIDNEVVQVRDNGQTVYQNAGKVDKKGWEASGNVNFAGQWQAGASYSHTRYTYAAFSEVSGVTSYNRAGKQLPWVPNDLYSVFLGWQHPAGYKARLQSTTWGRYYLDNANSATYDGYRFVTSLMLGYETGPHSLSLHADNLFDKRYAVEVKKDLNGTVSYTAAAPRSFMLSYGYRFK